MGSSIETCTAGAGTLSVEFTLLSRLVGDPTYENLARRAVRTLWDKRHPETGLVGEFWGVCVCVCVCVCVWRRRPLFPLKSTQDTC